ncbi:MAG TPA: YHS domain-containing (seleno)protein [Phnomibacter sp.]|nr:YHS domain-containing (seleno)protein [Phnomibacter sp.]
MKLLLASIAMMATLCVAGRSFGREKSFNLEKGLAIQGYDPVAYFTMGKAVKGSGDHRHTHQGVTYYFSSKAHKEAFMANPGRFEPQYGGWCAYAMGATGEKVEVDPASFKVVEGKLYLFYKSWTNNTLAKWNKDEAGLKKQAELNWKKFFK